MKFFSKSTQLKDGMGPPVDHLLRFLLQASADTQPTCANCDNKSRVPMYYCNTCGKLSQSLFFALRLSLNLNNLRFTIFLYLKMYPTFLSLKKNVENECIELSLS